MFVYRLNAAREMVQFSWRLSGVVIGYLSLTPEGDDPTVKVSLDLPRDIQINHVPKAVPGHHPLAPRPGQKRVPHPGDKGDSERRAVA